MPNHGRSRSMPMPMPMPMPSPVEDRPMFLESNPLPNTMILKIENSHQFSIQIQHQGSTRQTNPQGDGKINLKTKN